MKITTDLHTHTHLSLCGEDSATIGNYVRSAKKNGLKKIGISDHFWDNAIPFPDAMRRALNAGDGEVVCDWYRNQDMRNIRRILPELEAADLGGVRFLFGAEVDYCVGRGAAIRESEAEKLDFMIVPNSHTHNCMDRALYEPYRKHADFMLKATEEICTAPTSRFVTALAHPFAAVCCPYPNQYVTDCITDEQFIEVFSMAKEKGIAVEANMACYINESEEQMRNDYMTRVLSLAKRAGCKFTFGSDSHADGEQDWITRSETLAAILGITETDLADIMKN